MEKIGLFLFGGRGIKIIENRETSQKRLKSPFLVFALNLFNKS